MPLQLGNHPKGTPTHPQRRTISLSYQGMPPMYSDMTFSSLLLLFILPEKNWIGWSRAFNCASLGSAHSIPEKKPVLQDSKSSWHVGYCKSASFTQHFLQNPSPTLVWTCTSPSPHIHWSDRYQTVFPTLELFHLWSTHVKSFSPARWPLADNWSSKLFKVLWILVQDRLEPPPTTHMPAFSICPSKSSQPPYYISECASIHSNNYLNPMKYFNTYLQ